MYERDCAFRRYDGGIRFIREERFNEAKDELCELKVIFNVADIYPPEKDTGAGFDWNGDIAEIRMRGFTGDWRRWRVLRGDEFDTAQAFLLREYGSALWQAGYDYAEALHLGEVA
jgi:hypothetical protein